MKNEQDALYWRYFYKFQSLLARDVNYLEMIAESEPSEGNGVRKESSLPFGLNHEAHNLAYLSKSGGSYPSEKMGYSSHCRYITLKLHPKIKEIRDEHENRLEVTEVSNSMYHLYLDKLEVDKRSYMDDKIEADKYYLVMSNDLVVGGFATTGRGYLTGLFSLKKGLGKQIFKLRLNQARLDMDRSVKQFRIFCTGDYLKEFYEDQGFKVTDIVEWEDQYAPKGWNYEEKGRPNLYNMEMSVLF